jgi:tryptophan synthase beta chain
VTDDDALRGFAALSRLEGIIPALETSHAIVWVMDNSSRWKTSDSILICVSGRGDKDMSQVAELGLLD